MTFKVGNHLDVASDLPIYFSRKVPYTDCIVKAYKHNLAEHTFKHMRPQCNQRCAKRFRAMETVNNALPSDF